jgi:AAA+ ATPase superfamily predicted ATPase
VFINRERELATLESLYSSQRAELFILYGRRRVGKTELLRAFCEGKRAIFFEADLGSEGMLLSAFSRAIGESIYDNPGLVFSSWDAAFEAVAHAAANQRLVVVLDEFGYLARANSAFPSILQRLWDTRLKETQLLLILCGSYISLMEREALTYRAPLYGRRSGQCLLEPLEFGAAAQFFARYDAADRVRAYACLGGIPAYLLQFDDRKTIQVNIRDAILSPHRFLNDEPRFLLREEVRDPANYFSVLAAIAAGKTHQNEIAQVAGFPNRDTAGPYLRTLQDLRLVERHVPITEEHPHKSRKGIYRLRDYFFRFWFRFVYPNESALARGGVTGVMERHIEPHLDEFVAPIFEEVARQHIWRMALTGQLPFAPQRVGGWWDKEHEIDVVAIGDHDFLVGECKWSSRPIGVSVLDELKRTAAALLAQGELGRPHYALFSRVGFTEELKKLAHEEDILLYVAADLIAA